MPRPAASPRLQSIDPTALARDVAVQAAQRAGLPRPAHPGRTKISRQVSAVAWFAVRGGSAGGPHRLDAIRSMVMGPAAAPGVGADWRDLSDLSTPLGVVVLAARGRLRLGDTPPRPVTGAELAALAGLDASHVRRLLRDGALAEAPMSDDERAAGHYPRAAKLIRPESARALLDGPGATTAPEGATNGKTEAEG